MSAFILSQSLLAAAALVCGTAWAQVMLQPVDEGARDESFAAFRADLLDAVARKDKPFILSILSADIRNSFGGDGGTSEFRSTWNFDGDDSEFWAELEAVLRMGGAFRTRDEFSAPYVFAMWPETLDAFEFVAVIGTNVNVRSEPSITAPIVARLSHEVVRLAEGRPATTWLKVALADGTAGYVNERYLRSPIDYRASFVRNDDRWMLRFFAAGD